MTPNRASEPEATERLASRICGDEITAFDYRTGRALDEFIAFTGIDAQFEEGDSRWRHALSFARACNASEEGRSGLPREVERLLEAMLAPGEFSSEAGRKSAFDELNDVLAGASAEIGMALDGSVQVRSTRRDERQAVVDEIIHSSFRDSLAESDLDSARAHYRKARQLFDAPEPDYENAAKEAVCCIESLAAALTGEPNFNRAIGKATREGSVPPALGWDDQEALRLPRRSAGCCPWRSRQSERLSRGRPVRRQRCRRRRSLPPRLPDEVMGSAKQQQLEEWNQAALA